MKQLEFDIYIGDNMISGQGKDIVGIVLPKTFLPNSRLDLYGNEYKSHSLGFTNLYNLGTYIADWINLTEDENLVKTTVHLNIKSLKKVFIGKKIINIIDKIQSCTNYRDIRNFNELL